MASQSYLLLIQYSVTADVSQSECLCGWNAHEGEVFNVQFSSDETSVYSMGKDNKFCQWSMNRSGEKMTEFDIHQGACYPTGGVKGEYFPNIPRGNLFAFESEDKFVLTSGPTEALVYQVKYRTSLYNIYYSLDNFSQSEPVLIANFECLYYVDM